MKTRPKFFANTSFIILGLYFIVGSQALLANESPSVLYYPETTTSADEFHSPLPALEQDSAAQYESRVLEKTGETYSITVWFPQIMLPSITESDREEVNVAIRQFVEGISNDDIQSFIEEAPDPELDFITSIKNELRVSFEIVHLDPNFVSIKFEVYFYGRGALQGNTSVTCFNYDFNKKSTFKLSDLFDPDSHYLEQISALAIKDLKDKSGREHQNSPEALEYAYARIESGASPLEENLGEFTFDGNSFTIYFQTYQVDCAAAGIQKSEIWSSELKGFKPAASSTV